MSLRKAIRKYIRLKKKVTLCLQEHLLFSCVRCGRYQSCKLYDKYAKSWIGLETLVRRATQMKRTSTVREYEKLKERALKGRSRKAAIKAFCLECCGFNRKEVELCQSPDCPLYPYRLK